MSGNSVLASSLSRAHRILPRAAGYVHTAMFVNTRRAPFDDRRVRQALALAVDRDAVVALLGGVRRARPSCQILPASFPGYQPYCPTTLDPDASGVWHAPDLDRARRLVRASATAGTLVTVSTVRGDPVKLAIGAYVARVLRGLGYRTRVHQYPGLNPYYQEVGRAANRSQIGFFGWKADYQAGSAFFANTSGGTLMRTVAAPARYPGPCRGLPFWRESLSTAAGWHAPSCR